MDDRIEQAQIRIGRRFNDPELVRRALTHASIADTRRDSNERLEFLGDSVLGLVCCERIYSLYPDLLEGEMTKIKSTVVSRQTCAALAKQLSLEDLLILGKGMAVHKVLPSSLGAALIESLVGAMYLDGGLDAARSFLIPLLDPLIQKAFASGHQENFKSVLQQVAQLRFGESPQYVVLDEKGPDHAKCFELCVELDGRRFESCWGASKKAAEQQAALLALRQLGVITETPQGVVVRFEVLHTEAEASAGVEQGASAAGLIDDSEHDQPSPEPFGIGGHPSEPSGPGSPSGSAQQRGGGSTKATAKFATKVGSVRRKSRSQTAEARGESEPPDPSQLPHQ